MAVSVHHKLRKNLYELMTDGSSRDRYASILTILVLHDSIHRPTDAYWRDALLAYLSKGTPVKEIADPVEPVIPSPFG